MKAVYGCIYWFEYMGDSLDDSRDKCKTLLSKKHIHFNEIFELDKEKWDGQLKPFYLYSGGWKCIHSIEPDPFYKP